MTSAYMPSPRVHASHGYTNGYAIGSGAPPQTPRSMVNGASGFSFRNRHERIDWKKIASIDVERIVREFDITNLQECIMGVTFCNIEQEVDVRMVDQNFVTIFKLAQLIIQYLLHSQEVMANNMGVAEERLQLLHADHEATKAELSQLREELQKVKQESHKRKKLLKNQQNLIQATANNYHKCMYCQKAFFNMAYLQSHLQRKHPEFTPRPIQAEDAAASKKVNEVSEKLEKELEELRERVKFAESQLVEEKDRAQEQIKAHLQQQQNQADAERHEEQHRKELDRWKQEQLHFQKVEMEKMQNMFMKELKEMHDKYSSSQTALENIQSKLGKQSMLGNMVDEDELKEQKKINRKQREEFEKLKGQLREEMTSLQNKMTDDLKKQEDKWREKQKEMKTSHRDEVKELKALLKQTKELLDIEREGGDKKGAKYERQVQDLVKKSKDYERQIRDKEKKIKELQVKASKHYEVVEPSSSPPAKMMIPDRKKMEPSSEEEEDDTDLDVDDGEFDEVDGSLKPDEHDTYSRNKEKIKQGMKEELKAVLQRNLAKRGVPEGMSRISTQSLENKVKVLKQERQQIAKNHGQFYDIRERFKRELDRKASEMRRSGQPAIKRSRSESPTVRQKAKSSSAPQKIMSYSKPQSKPQLKKQTSAPVKSQARAPVKTPPPVAPRSPDTKGRGKGPPGRGPVTVPRASSRVSFEDEYDDEDDEDDDNDDEDEDDESEEEESNSLEDRKAEQIYKTPNVPARPAPTQPTSNGFHNGTTEGDEDDDSEWDSEEISELEEVKPKPSSGRPGSATRPPQGPMVASLTKSIEMQLSGRKAGQKPAGGVDLGGSGSQPPQPAPRSPSPSPTPRIPTIPDAGADDDEDSASISLSSLGDSFSAAGPKATSPTPAPRLNTSKKATNDTDMSSNTYGTSLWGSSKANTAGDRSKGNGTGKSSIVSVTDFDDDDDDFDLDEL